MRLGLSLPTQHPCGDIPISQMWSEMKTHIQLSDQPELSLQTPLLHSACELAPVRGLSCQRLLYQQSPPLWPWGERGIEGGDQEREGGRKGAPTGTTLTKLVYLWVSSC